MNIFGIVVIHTVPSIGTMISSIVLGLPLALLSMKSTWFRYNPRNNSQHIGNPYRGTKVNSGFANASELAGDSLLLLEATEGRRSLEPTT